MQAITVTDGRLALAEVPAPRAGNGTASADACANTGPGPGEVLIDVHATAVNRADLLQAAGLYPPPPGASDILGLECAGRVAAIGEGVTQWAVGDAVCALLAGGGYASQVLVDARHCLPLPAGLSFEEGAALPEAFATAWLNLFREAGLHPGERVLLPAGASGVGTAAIQLCNAFGNPCFVSVGTAEKLAACLALGATAGIVRSKRALTDLLGQEGVDVILDAVAGSALDSHLRLLKPDGRLVLIGLMGGRTAPVDLGRLLVKRLRVIGSTLRSRHADDKAALIAELRERVWPLFASGALRPVIDSRFPLAEAAAAHAHVAANRNIGKVILTVVAR
ncbi:MAG: NAD(P)H-quinone oxidoreductase [Moraxellaceae bacterium]|nr:NAD(P)H-quinone oxidoreductase [Moraxellaceae bacterium]